MNDPLARTVEEIQQSAKHESLCLYYGWMAGEKLPTVHWNEERGGDWRAFLECAKNLKAQVVYLNWTPFEQFQVEEAVSELELKMANNDGLSDELEDAKDRLNRMTKFKTKVGLTCLIDLAFVAHGVIHIYQKTADWFDEFQALSEDIEDDDD